jgi:hypothetical protein
LKQAEFDEISRVTLGDGKAVCIGEQQFFRIE